MLKKMLIIMLSILVSSLFAGCSDKQTAAESDKKQEPITLRYAWFAGPSTYHFYGIEEFAKRVEERTEGKVKVETFPGGTLLELPNMYDGVTQGIADIGSGMPGTEPGRFPLLSLLEFPYGFPNSKVATQVGKDLLEEYQHDFLKDYKVITFYLTPPGYIMTQTKVENLQDLSGQEIRSVAGFTLSLDSMGATPVGMPMSEVAEALQTGIVKGYVSTVETLKDNGFAEFVSYVNTYPMGSGVHAALMDIDAWNKLTPDVQQVIEEVGLEMADWTSEYIDDYGKKALEWAVQEHGIEVINLSPEETEKWNLAIQPVIEKKVGELEAQGLPAREFVKRIHELNEKYKKEFSQ